MFLGIEKCLIMKYRRYFFGEYKQYEILKDSLGNWIIKDDAENKYYLRRENRISPISRSINFVEIKWKKIDSACLFLSGLSIFLLITMINRALKINFDGDLFSFLILLINICVHEFGHNWALKLFGKKLAKYRFKIKTVFPSIVCNTSEAYMLPNYEKCFVFYAGILVNIMCCFLLSLFGLLQECIPTLSFILFNLLPLPVIETDGFNILYYVVLNKIRYRKKFTFNRNFIIQFVFVLIYVVLIFYKIRIKRN